MPEGPERRSLLAGPIFPIVMAVAWVLDMFGFSGDPLPHLWRPLIITVVAVLAFVGIVWLASGRRPLPSLIAGILVLLFLKAWPLLGAVLAIAAWRAAAAAVRRMLREAPLPEPGAVQAMRLSNVFGLVVLAVVLVQLVPRGVIGFMPATAERGDWSATAPNMYFVLLDGYGWLLEMVDHLTADDPNAVIVLFGDHGLRFSTGVSTEYFRNFFAARTPGHPGLFPDDISPVNVLSLIENTYLGTELPMRDYEAWESKDNFLLRLVRWLPDPQ